MSDANSPGATYHCPTCGSEDVESFEFGDGSSFVSDRVHIYCQDPDCGWIHRDLMRDGRIVNNA